LRDANYFSGFAAIYNIERGALDPPVCYSARHDKSNRIRCPPIFVKPFLTANWRYLAMMNFVVDRKILAPFVPAGTEVDFYEGETFLSVVGFLFLDTRVLGIPVPLHRDFEEVNLRFYVKRKSIDGWKRGVVFIRELVPRRAIATLARVFYGEPYSAVPMKHSIVDDTSGVSVSYEWRRGRKWESLAMTSKSQATNVSIGSHEEFITEHYWGYTAGLRTSEYRVEHPRWKIWNASNASFKADVSALYGKEFVAPFSAPPASQFIAEGSHVQVWRKIDDPVLIKATTANRR
jgi:uncharacterized protein